MPGPASNVKLLISRSGSWADANARIEVGDIIWEQVGEYGDCPGPFFDGNTADTTDLDVAWSGTADASTSTMTGTKIDMDIQSPFPPIYRSTVCAVSGFSAVLPEGSYIEPVHGTEPTTNGMTPGFDAAVSFDACRDGSGDMTVSLMWKDPGGSLQAIPTTFTAPLDGRYNATAHIPATAESAFWRWYVASGDEPAYVSRILIENNTTVTGEFFDGSTPPAYWNGTADDSTSSLDPEPLVVPLPTGEYNDGKPSYSEIVSDATVGIDSVTAYYYDVEAPTTMMTRISRTLKIATCTEGPTVTQQFDSASAYLKRAEFIITCPDPWAYGNKVLAANMVSGALVSNATDVTMTVVPPGTYDLTCYAEDVSYVPTDPNCGTIPKPPRPKPVDPCDPGSMNRGYLFFIPPTLLEELAGTYPYMVIKKQTVIQKGAQIRCWPLPSADKHLDNISACDTRGWLRLGGIPANQGFILDCAAQSGTMTDIKVTGGTISLPATHFVYPPASLPATAGQTVDQIPLTWPEMYGGNYGYFIYVEQNSTVAPSIELWLETRR